MNWEALRPGQRLSVRTILDRISQREPYTANVLPTRYGKSDVMRVVSTFAWADGQVATTLALSPNALLRHQLADARRWTAAFDRYQIAQPVRIYEMITLPRAFPGHVITFTPNDETFLSITQQLAERNIDLFCDWVDSVCAQKRLPVLVHVDECHMGGESLAWGLVAQRLAEAGALIVLHTATAFRSDGKRIPGFEFDVLSKEPVTVYRKRPGSVPEKVRVEIYTGEKQLLKLRAHHTTTFKEAWQESNLAVCKVTRLPFDIDLSKIRAEIKQRATLHDLSVSECRKALTRILRHRTVIDEGVERAVKELIRFRQTLPTAAMIVFCCNDTDTEDREVNKHARQIAQAVARYAPQLAVEIATSADDEQAGKTRIEQFQAGLGDVLIVKQMASLGLDVERLKIGLDLSPVRTPAGYVQRMMRIATPCGPIHHCIWVCPDDVIGDALHQDLVESQGGEMASSDLAFQKFYEVDREEAEPPTLYSVAGTDDADFGDTDGREAERATLRLVNALLDTFPSLTAFYTHPQIADMATAHGWEAPTGPRLVDPVDDIAGMAEVLYGKITSLMDELTAHRMKTAGFEKGEYGEVSRDLWLRVYQYADIPPGVRMRDVRALPQIRRLLTAAETISAQMLTGE